MKKLSLVVLLFFLAAPAAFAYDVGTAGIVAGLAGAGAALALTFGAPAAVGTVALGALVAGLSFPTLAPSTSTGEVVVQLSPSAQLPVPDGWEPPPPGQTDPLPPATSAPILGYAKSGTSSPIYGSRDEACQAYGLDFLYDPSTYCKNQKTGQFLSGPNAVTGCPSGYTYSAGSCNLTSPSDVIKPPDNTCTIKRVGNSFVADSQDPDCVSGKIPATTGILRLFTVFLR